MLRRSSIVAASTTKTRGSNQRARASQREILPWGDRPTEVLWAQNQPKIETGDQKLMRCAGGVEYVR